jgi:hypothetical protein
MGTPSWAFLFRADTMGEMVAQKRKRGHRRSKGGNLPPFLPTMKFLFSDKSVYLSLFSANKRY